VDERERELEEKEEEEGGINKEIRSFFLFKAQDGALDLSFCASLASISLL
jgi:hypothetical protein